MTPSELDSQPANTPLCNEQMNVDLRGDHSGFQRRKKPRGWDIKGIAPSRAIKHIIKIIYFVFNLYP